MFTIKNAILVSFLFAMSFTTNAIPIKFTWQDTIVGEGAEVPGISDGDVITATIIADNGGVDLFNQSWMQADILSATVTIGSSYVAMFGLPHFTNDPIFRTNIFGNLATASWFDIDEGANDVDNAGGTRAPQFFSNAFRTSISGSFFRYQIRDLRPSNWTVSRVMNASEPGILALVVLCIMGIFARRLVGN